MDLDRLYQYRFRDVSQQQRTDVWVPIVAHIQRVMGNPERVLDPAAGMGEFIGLVDAGDRWAVDMVAHEEAGAFEGVNLIVSEIMKADLPEDFFDGIFVSNFLEHLDSQEGVFEFLARMREVAAPGGRIAVMGPNIAYAGKEYWDFADHIVPLTHRAVAEHLYMAGFEPELIVPRFLPYSFTSRLPASPALTAAYLRFKPAWRILGKQFLVIGRKPDRPSAP